MERYQLEEGMEKNDALCTMINEDSTNYNADNRIDSMLFTHTDGDGLGCALLAQFSKKYNFRICPCQIGSQDDAILDYIKDYGFPEYMLITDLSISDDLAEMLDEEMNKKDSGFRVKLIDHHPSNHLNDKYEWCTVMPTLFDKPSSASILMYTRMFLNKDYVDGIKYDGVLKDIIRDIDRYDTWKWKENPCEYDDGHDEEDVTILINTIGFWDTLERLNKCVGENRYLSMDDFSIIMQYKMKRDEYIDSQINDIRVMKYSDFDHKFRDLETNPDYTIAVIILDYKYVNIFSERVLNDFNFNFVMVLNPKDRVINLRTNKKNRENFGVNLTHIAQLFGGGGHPESAGAKLSTDDFIEILKMYYYQLDKPVME